jgi:hypothetical protein
MKRNYPEGELYSRSSNAAARRSFKVAIAWNGHGYLCATVRRGPYDICNCGFAPPARPGR